MFASTLHGLRPWTAPPGSGPQRLVAIDYISRSAPPSADSPALPAPAGAGGGGGGGGEVPGWVAGLDAAARAIVHPYDMPGMPTAVSDGRSLRLLR